MTFVIPAKSQVGVLDPELSGEGLKVIMSDGEQMLANVLPPKPVFPDLSGVKSLARYFNRKDYHVFPAWLYHPTEEARLVKNLGEAVSLGVSFRETTPDERARFGVRHVWDWEDGSPWRPSPQRKIGFDPNSPASGGKNYMPPAANPAMAQSAMLAELIPAVAAAVASSLQAKGPAAPAGIDDAEWAEYIKFKAWQKAAQAVDEVGAEIGRQAADEPAGDLLSGNALTAKADSVVDEERTSWLAEAERKGVKIDKRWATERIKDEVLKAA